MSINDRASVLSHSFETEIGFGKLDPRLRLLKCDKKLKAYWPGRATPRTNMVVGIRCVGSRPWKIYLPVSVKRYQKVLVSTASLPRGHTITSADLSLEKRDIHRVRHHITDPQRIDGMILKRPISAGAALTRAMLTAPRLVSRGDDVTIIARSGLVAISVKGKAMMNGRKGDKIRVRNTSSRQVIQAIVTSNGRVELAM